MKVEEESLPEHGPDIRPDGGTGSSAGDGDWNSAIGGWGWLGIGVQESADDAAHRVHG